MWIVWNDDWVVGDEEFLAVPVDEWERRFAERVAAGWRPTSVVEPVPRSDGVARARYFFDAGSGVCLWAADEPTAAAYRRAIDHRHIGLSASLEADVGRTIDRYNESIDWNDPGGSSPWSSEENVAFDVAAGDLLSRLRSELGPAWDLIDRYRPLA